MPCFSELFDFHLNFFRYQSYRPYKLIPCDFHLRLICLAFIVKLCNLPEATCQFVSHLSGLCIGSQMTFHPDIILFGFSFSLFCPFWPC